jgi:hypothetical protein
MARLRRKKTTTVARDATFSRETRDLLAELAAHLKTRRILVQREDIHAAVADVIARWDGNEPTEIEIPV